MKNIVVVGSWAKEHITIKNIKGNSFYRVFCYLDAKNPGIISLVDGYKIGSLYDLSGIVEYVKSICADLVLITTAVPLSLGLVDKLKHEGVLVFGPGKEAAKLECDKVFTRNLMKKYGINVIPEFEVFKDKNKAINYAKSLKWEVAVKPVGLTEGLGVKVFKEQLKDKEDVIDYIQKILHNKIGGISKVLIEEKIKGQEFTIQTLIYKNTIVLTPAVQDFKKLLPGDKGLNTASMGSYSDVGYLLPFIEEKDYEFALNIVKKTIQVFEKETGQKCCGFLYGQFILTDDGVKLVEYNFRPGDPEWLNTLFILEDNIADVIFSLLKGEDIKLYFQTKATVCKYIVPKGYPMALNKNLNISFPKDKIRKLGVDFYYSCGIKEDGMLNVGKERGIAFISKGDTIFEANRKIEKAISLVNGDFHYRKDIGSEKMVGKKKDYQKNG